MTYAPINVDAYTNAYSGAIAGMAISGWITDPTSADYSNVATIAGAFAQAFDVVWNNATALNWLQIQSIQSVCQEQFAGHAPGSLDNTVLATPSNWAVPAAACAALVLEGDSFVASEGITPNTPGGGAGGGGPIFRQLWLDTTKPDSGDGSIASPYNTWADAIAPLGSSGGSQPWVINLAQLIDASEGPIPNIGADGHNTGRVKLQGPIQQSTYASFENSNIVVTGLAVDPQDGSDFALNISDLTVIGITLPAGGMAFTLTGENANISSMTAESGTVTGGSHLINCSLTSITLFAWDLRMVGGTLDSTIEIGTGVLDDVELLSSCDFKWGGTLTITNSRFQAGAVLRCSSSQQLNLDLDSWGSMVAAGVTFPDTFPTMVITPWVPIIGTALLQGANAINPGGVQTFDLGVIFPQEAEKNTACIASFGVAPSSSDMDILGAFIDNNRHLNVIVKNRAATTQNLTDATFTATYLPRLSP